MPPCKHFDICQLEIDSYYSSEYCFLHHPNRDKPAQTFSERIRLYLREGRSDFRHVTFPRDAPANFEGVRFSSKVDFTDAVFGSGVSLAKAILPHGLAVKTKALSGFNLTDAKIIGAFTLDVEDAQQIQLKNTEISGPLSITGKDIRDLNFCGPSAHCSERVDITATKITRLNLDDSNLDKGFVLKTDGIEDIRFTKCRVSKGDVKIQCKIANHINGASASFNGDCIIHGTLLQDLNLTDANFGGYDIRGEVKSFSFQRATIEKFFRWEGSVIEANINLDEINFAETAEFFFDGTRLTGYLTLNAPSNPPSSIHLNGSRISGNFTVQSELGKPFISIIADKDRPRFNGKEVTFTNVDLSRCLLTGNSIPNVKISNVKWARRYSRQVLYDEIIMRRKKFAPWGNLKETYQILKEQYSRLGDHATSGDFHYGEMEAKRREYGWPRRILCPELPYWLLSGYGTGYVRAFMWLAVWILGFAVFYYSSGGATLRYDIVKSLLFSFQSAFLLRPTQPDNVSIIVQWAQSVETVFAPVLVALFALALRMRLKR